MNFVFDFWFIFIQYYASIMDPKQCCFAGASFQVYFISDSSNTSVVSMNNLIVTKYLNIEKLLLNILFSSHAAKQEPFYNLQLRNAPQNLITKEGGISYCTSVSLIFP